MLTTYSARVWKSPFYSILIYFDTEKNPQSFWVRVLELSSPCFHAETKIFPRSVCHGKSKNTHNCLVEIFLTDVLWVKKTNPKRLQYFQRLACHNFSSHRISVSVFCPWRFTHAHSLAESWRLMGLGVVSSEPVEQTDVRCPALRSGMQVGETGDSSSPLSPWKTERTVITWVNILQVRDSMTQSSTRGRQILKALCCSHI